MVRICVGNEPFLLQMAKDAFVKEVQKQGDCEYAEYEQFAEVVEFMSTPSILYDKTAVVYKASSLKELDTKVFLKFVKNLETQNQLFIIVKGSIGVNEKKRVERIEEVAKITCYMKDERALSSMVQQLCVMQQANFTDAAKRALIQRLDYANNETVTLFTFNNFIGQLKYLSEVIDEHDVIANVPDFREGNRFGLASLIAKKDMESVLREQERLMREKDFCAIKLLGLLHREWRIAYRAKIGFSAGQQGVRYVCNELLRFDEKSLIKGMECINQAVRNIKSGIEEKQAFQMCLAELLVIETK